MAEATQGFISEAPNSKGNDYLLLQFG